jgi:methyl-accepting chemotaxis protein
MHRIEGKYNVNNFFDKGPPGTIFTEEWGNAVQEEIVNVVSAAGLVLKTADTDTRTQLLSGLEILFAGGVYVSGLVTRIEALEAVTSGLDVPDLNNRIDTNLANINSNATRINTNTANINSNATRINTNTANINSNANAINANTALINTNTANINSNATVINYNAADIISNANAINANTALISANTANINSNAARINYNVGEISNNATDIANNLVKINSNAVEISKNRTQTLLNSAAIAANIDNITSNASAINTNTANISWAVLDINSNASAINTNTAAIAALEDRIDNITLFTEVITSTGTWMVPSDVHQALIAVYGAGGGGSGASDGWPDPEDVTSGGDGGNTTMIGPGLNIVAYGGYGGYVGPAGGDTDGLSKRGGVGGDFIFKGKGAAGGDRAIPRIQVVTVQSPPDGAFGGVNGQNGGLVKQLEPTTPGNVYSIVIGAGGAGGAGKTAQSVIWISGVAGEPGFIEITYLKAV